MLLAPALAATWGPFSSRDFLSAAAGLFTLAYFGRMAFREAAQMKVASR
jgi:hypothetical protein